MILFCRPVCSTQINVQWVAIIRCEFSPCQLWQMCCAAFSLERKTITTKENMESTRGCAAPLNNDPESLSKVVQQCSWKLEVL